MELTEDFFEATYEKYRRTRIQELKRTMRHTLQVMKEDAVRLRDQKTLLSELQTYSYYIIEELKAEILELL